VPIFGTGHGIGDTAHKFEASIVTDDGFEEFINCEFPPQEPEVYHALAGRSLE